MKSPQQTTNSASMSWAEEEAHEKLMKEEMTTNKAREFLGLEPHKHRLKLMENGTYTYLFGCSGCSYRHWVDKFLFRQLLLKR